MISHYINLNHIPLDDNRPIPPVFVIPFIIISGLFTQFLDVNTSFIVSGSDVRYAEIGPIQRIEFGPYLIP